MHICLRVRMLSLATLSSQRAISGRYHQMGMSTRCAAAVQLRHVHWIMHSAATTRQHWSPLPSVPDTHRLQRLVRNGENGLWENTANNNPRVGGRRCEEPFRLIARCRRLANMRYGESLHRAPCSRCSSRRTPRVIHTRQQRVILHPSSFTLLVYFVLARWISSILNNIVFLTRTANGLKYVIP